MHRNLCVLIIKCGSKSGDRILRRWDISGFQQDHIYDNLQVQNLQQNGGSRPSSGEPVRTRKSPAASQNSLASVDDITLRLLDRISVLESKLDKLDAKVDRVLDVIKVLFLCTLFVCCTHINLKIIYNHNSQLTQ